MWGLHYTVHLQACETIIECERVHVSANSYFLRR